jgi:bidirectional [NiFe] hydrogenase diaphorase subunit
VDIRLVIDDEVITAPEGASLLTVARAAGRDVPGLCHHDAVPANASCRLCLVELRRPGRDWTQLTTSCDYPVSDGLTVVTDSPRIRELRAMNLSLLLRRAPQAPILLELAGHLGAGGSPFAPIEDAPLPDCILCELCVRVCSAAGYEALAVNGRGSAKYVGPPFAREAAEDCVGCGSCAEVCPTDCISLVDTATTRTIWGRRFDLLACADCGRTITTKDHRRAMDPGVLRSLGDDELCDVCKRRRSCERLT